MTFIPSVGIIKNLLCTVLLSMVFPIRKYDFVLCCYDNFDEKVSSRCDGNCLGSVAVLLLMCGCIPGIGGCMLCVDIVCVMKMCILPKLSSDRSPI